MAELAVAALMAAVTIYAMSGFAKLRSRPAYRAYQAGLATTTVVPRPLTGPLAAALVAAEAVVAGLCATALIMTFLSPRPPVLTAAALTAAAALAAVLTVGVALTLRRGAAAPCLCFGATRQQRLSGVHLARNACMLSLFAAGAVSTGIGSGLVAPPAAVLAALAGGTVALLLSRLDELTALFRVAAR